jgi:ABC-type taurine transport system ATPase subunit
MPRGRQWTGRQNKPDLTRQAAAMPANADARFASPSADDSGSAETVAAGAVSLQHVTIEYSAGGERLTAVRDISFEINPGNLVCVVGPSGCGKTSLLHAIAGLTQYSSGDILIGGQKVLRPGKDRAVVFQRPALLPWKTVQANVAYGLRLYGENRRTALIKADRALGTVGLLDFKNY